MERSCAELYTTVRREWRCATKVLLARTFVGHIKTQLGVEGTKTPQGVHDQGIGLVQEVLGCEARISLVLLLATTRETHTGQTSRRW